MISGLSDGPEAAEEEREAKTRADELNDDMRSVMATQSGRRLFYDVLANMGAFDGVYNARGAGRLDAAIELINRIKGAGRSYYHLMLEENDK